MLATINSSIGKTSKTSSKESFVQSMQTQRPSTDWNPQLISKRVTLWMNTSMNSKTLSRKGYSDPKTIVVKFRQGLDTQIQNAIATMPSGRPSNMVPTDWYTAARTIDQNQATNDVRGRSASSDVSSDISPSPLYIPPHRR